MIHTHGESNCGNFAFSTKLALQRGEFPDECCTSVFFLLFTNHLLFVTDHSHLIIPVTDVVIISNEQWADARPKWVSAALPVGRSGLDWSGLWSIEKDAERSFRFSASVLMYCTYIQPQNVAFSQKDPNNFSFASCQTIPPLGMSINLSLAVNNFCTKAQFYLLPL